jgi:hypothetical protein
MTDDQPASANGTTGEGNYEAARAYQEAQADFAHDKARVKKGAEDAAEALDGPDGEELERARRESGSVGQD